MKITETHLYTAALPKRVADALGLRPSRYGRYKLRPEQRETLLALLGKGPKPKKKKVKPSRLMPHQRECVEWMVSRLESGEPGGYIAHEMGLGKTFTTIEIIRRLG